MHCCSVLFESIVISTDSGGATMVEIDSLLLSPLFFVGYIIITADYLYIPVQHDTLYSSTVLSVVMTRKIQYSYSTHVVPMCAVRHYL